MSSILREKLSTLTRVVLLLMTLLLGAGALSAAQASDPSQPKKDGEKQARITEEILVVGEAPQDVRVGTVSVMGSTALNTIKPLDLSDVMRLVPATAVTVGQKNEFTLLLRGIDAKRIVLLLDGIPVYEPYYGTFDLKTISAANISSLQVTKGPSSVLYGPNTLGGIINVITERPAAEPRLTLSGSFGQDTTWSAGLDGSYRWKRFAMVGNAEYQYSKGFRYPDDSQEGVVVTPGGFRANSDYRRLSLTGKLFYYPTDDSEILVEGDLFRSQYGMDSPLFIQKPRYWRFPEWDRSSVSAGGFIGLGETSLLRFRVFTVSYDNILDQFKDQAMTIRQFRSTFDNSTLGAFALAEFNLSSVLGLKASLNFERDKARQQDDVSAPWLEYHQETYSAAVEGRYRFLEGLTLNAGVSLDTIAKFTGPATTRLNPLVGFSYAPTAGLDLHLSFAKKTRFPSMRSLYSTGSGNPDLLTEDGTVWELGGAYSGPVEVTAAVFAYRLNNMIDSVQLPTGFRQYFNIGRASINGFELDAHRTFGPLEATFSYTLLDHRNETGGRPLDGVPNNSFNADLTLTSISNLRLSLRGLFASHTFWFDSSSGNDLQVPAYFELDATAVYRLGSWEMYVKAANLLNSFYYTDPGFPWRGRYFEAGVRMAVL